MARDISKPRVLIFVNMEYWRERLETLIPEKYDVVRVTDYEEAQKMLKEQVFHVLILSVERNTDTNATRSRHGLIPASDTPVRSGLDLLMNLNQQKLVGLDDEPYDVYTIIALTGETDGNQVMNLNREVTSLGAVELRRDYTVTSETISQIIDDTPRRLRVNLRLGRMWDFTISSASAISRLRIGDAPPLEKVTERQGKGWTVKHEAMWHELDDLLKRLYFERQSLIVYHMGRGFSGAALLRVKSPRLRYQVVKFGSYEKIEKEHVNYRRYIQNRSIAKSHTPDLIDFRRTHHLGGIIYDFLGIESKPFKNFGEYYAATDDEDSIMNILDQLKRVCLDWYKNQAQPQEAVDLFAEYKALLKINPELLKSSIPRLMSGNERFITEFDNNSVTFADPNDEDFNQKLANPISSYSGFKGQWTRATVRCVTHGDFNFQNILIDHTGNVWLIDFYRTGIGHILRDIVQLETYVRIHLLGADQATLSERFILEKALNAAITFDDLEDSSLDELVVDGQKHSNDALQKCYKVCRYLRLLSKDMGIDNPELQEFYLGAFFFSLDSMKYFSLDKLQIAHCVISAAILADRLGFDTK